MDTETKQELNDKIGMLADEISKALKNSIDFLCEAKGKLDLMYQLHYLSNRK